MKRRMSLIALAFLISTFGFSREMAQQSGRNDAGARSPHGEEHETVGEMSEDVARVRFQKLGYTDIGEWTRNGDYLESTAKKDGKTWQIRIHVRTGARDAKPSAGR
jgi:hypothetical protein